ncbi:MAG: RdgB/HAM1 family non-canonical purine NTP pyrophosphatase [Actinobacteria bacterium]|nr:RdgB/HAM1 family non-canonical purine NTP pyrophosphatase [Actinomycetota bacterium]
MSCWPSPRVASPVCGRSRTGPRDRRARREPPVILATANLHKVGEMRELLPGVELEPLPEGYEPPVEDGESFEANALIKARAAHAALGGAAIADDSGIEAYDLGGAPGVYSARYAGQGAGDEANLDKLIREVDAAAGDRRAAYVCVLALVEEDGTEHVFEATCSGHLLGERRGSGGFGYDPIFVPDDTDDDRTMAELTAAEKNAISHRGRAARLLLAHLARG